MGDYPICFEDLYIRPDLYLHDFKADYILNMG